MDALSALKMMGTPELGARLTDPAQGIGAAKPIPLPELDKLGSALSTQAVGQAQPAGSFQNILGNFVNEVSEKQAAAGDAVNGLMSGKNVSLHQAMISMEEASVSFQLMVEVRNKLLDSYQELMRMQV
jgi:flagellar hook-basal body complex protein FliE